MRIHASGIKRHKRLMLKEEKMRKFLTALLLTATVSSLHAANSVGDPGTALGRQHFAAPGVSVGFITPLANSIAVETPGSVSASLANEALAAVGQPCRRLHPNKHFESFSNIKFDERKNRNFANSSTTLGPKTEDVIALASDPVLLENGALDAYPVTNGEYQSFIQDTGYPAPYHWDGGIPPEGLEGAPVVNVSLDDAQAFAKWSGKRLPTEDEWMSAQDQLSWDLEMPENEWLAAPNADERAMVLNRRNGQFQNVNRSLSAADTTFRLVSPR